jgi:hypothetical protein
MNRNWFKRAKRTKRRWGPIRFPKGEQILGLILAQKEKGAESAVHLRLFPELVPDGADADAARRLPAEVEQRSQGARK